MSTIVTRKCQLVLISKLYKYSDSPNVVQTLISHAIKGSSKQLCKTLKMKVIDAPNAGEGYKKIRKCCQLAVSTV